MGKGKICRGIIAFITPFIPMAYHVYPSRAVQVKQFDVNDGEVVFLLDASVSMNKQDKEGWQSMRSDRQPIVCPQIIRRGLSSIIPAYRNPFCLGRI